MLARVRTHRASSLPNRAISITMSPQETGQQSLYKWCFQYGGDRAQKRLDMRSMSQTFTCHPSRHSIFKMADDESKTNTSLSWFLGTSRLLKAFINNSATSGNDPCRRRIKNEHVIVMVLGNISLAQGLYKQLGHFRQ